jgi:hypothetical protein
VGATVVVLVVVVGATVVVLVVVVVGARVVVVVVGAIAPSPNVTPVRISPVIVIGIFYLFNFL